MTLHERSNRHYLLICTVGGTAEQIVASIRHWKPARVLFVHSAGTRATAEAVSQEQGLLRPGGWDSLEIHDAQDFGDCVRRMRGLEQQIGGWRRKGPEYDVAVDFTGGTKCMSAALVCVSRAWHCEFSYVGGTERTKGGIGIVVSGKEQMVFAQNPWNALGYQAMVDACLLFDQHAFIPAAKMLDDARNAADDGSVKRSLSTLRQLCEGYGLWDRFQHKEAIPHIADVLKNANDLHAVLGPELSESLCRSIRRDQQRLQQLVAQPLSRVKIADLLANALRRRHEARYDDGVARLYRAIESLAQLSLAERHEIPSTDNVPLNRVPEPLRDEWALRVRDGKLQVGLQDAFALLDELGDQTGKAFKALRLDDRERSPLAARNQSILAHGFEPVGMKVFDQVWRSAMSLGGFSDSELPEFPHLASN
jgi:CRISPR-associated protein (TIGR02710 family)